MKTLLIVLSIAFASTAHASAHEHHGTKMLTGVIRSHLQPTAARSGEPGTTIRWHSTVCNLGKKTQTWPVSVRLDKPIATTTVLTPSITVPAGQCYRGDVQFTNTFTAGPGDDETWVYLTTGPLTVERTITRCWPEPKGCTHHPR